MTKRVRDAANSSTEPATTVPEASFGAVVLAAGGSSRLGRPKQLAVHEGLPLVIRAAQAALKTGAYPVVVVLGANAALVRATLAGLPVVLVENADWASGMGTSVAAGVRAVVSRAPSARGVLVTLVDQPLVGNAALRRLIETWACSDARSSGGDIDATIAVAAYADTIGVPAVFGCAHFDALCSLHPAAGAARLLRCAKAPVSRVSMPEAAMDVDTADDLERLGAREPRARS